jgi:hypothetical protein
MAVYMHFKFECESLSCMQEIVFLKNVLEFVDE